MKRIDVLKNSLEKKQTKFNEKLDEHFADVKAANGQPLNDKRNGITTLRRWEQQNNTLLNLQKEIEKTETAIIKEERKQKRIATVNDNLPAEIITLVEDGTLKQWGKYPHVFFVDGVDKARIIWDAKRKKVMTKYAETITDSTQWRKFAQTCNSLVHLNK